MEQIPFSFEATPSFDDLVALYKKEVGIDPTFRNLARAELLAALDNPAAERERIAEIDRESDKEDITSTYRR